MADGSSRGLPPGLGNIEHLSGLLSAYLPRTLGVVETVVDRGTALRQWLASRVPVLGQRGAGDGEVSAAEWLQESFVQLQEVALGTGRTDFGSELCSPMGGSSFLCYFRAQGATLPPWLLDDSNLLTSEDGELRQRVDQIVTQTRGAVGVEEHSVGSRQYNERLLDRLLPSLTMTRNAGGLGLHYNNGESYRARDGIETYRTGWGACHGFSFIFYAMAARAGLNPIFIRISGQRNNDGTMEEIFHIGVAVRLDPDNPDSLVAVDPSTGQRLNATDYQWYPLTELEMMAYQLRNLVLYTGAGATPEETFLDWQEDLLMQALSLAPDNFEILNDLAWFYRQRRPDDSRYQQYRDRVLAINPAFSAIWTESE